MGPDLDPNCLQRLSADDKRAVEVKEKRRTKENIKNMLKVLSIKKIISTALKKVMMSQNLTVSLSQEKERNINTKCLKQIMMMIVAVTRIKDAERERSINTGEMTLIVTVVIQTIAVEVRERGKKEERSKENIKRENIKNMMKVLLILNLNKLLVTHCMLGYFFMLLLPSAYSLLNKFI